MAVPQTNTTLIQLVDLFKDIADRHMQINDFGFGTTDEIGESRRMLYPYLWITVVDDSTLVFGSGGISHIDFSLTLIVADKVNNQTNNGNQLGEESNNGLEVSSDTQQMIYDIMAELSTHPGYDDMNIKVTNDITLSPAWDEDDGRVNGWTATLDLRMPFRLTYCNAPFSNTYIPSLPLPCNPATILNSDSSYSTSVASGDTLILPDGLINNSDSSYIVNLPATNGLTIPDITHTDSDGSPITLPAQTPMICTPGGVSGHNNKVFKSGCTTSRFTNDDGVLQMGNGADFLTLTYNNHFGNTDRFTDRNGAQIYPDGIVCDWSTWKEDTGYFLAYQKDMEPRTRLDILLTTSPFTRDGFGDWYVPNVSQVLNICNFGIIPGAIFQWWNYPPFNYDELASGFDDRFWTSTFASGNAYVILYIGVSTKTNYWGTHKTKLVREFNVSEL